MLILKGRQSPGMIIATDLISKAEITQTETGLLPNVSKS